MEPYAELQVTSNFTFLRGASHPHELVETAASLGQQAIAITDRNSLAGVVRAHIAAKPLSIKLLVAARLDFADGPSLLCLPTNCKAYRQLATLLPLGKRRTIKGQCELYYTDLIENYDDQIFITLPPKKLDAVFVDNLKNIAERAPGRCYLAASHNYLSNSLDNIARLGEIAYFSHIPLVATNDVHYHVPERHVLQDTLTCIRESCTIDQAGFRLASNAEQYLKSPEEMARLFKSYPEAIAHTIEITEACTFSLDELQHQYPKEIAPSGISPQDYLAQLAYQGAHERYSGHVPDKVQQQINHELRLIGQLNYVPYFLTVHDIVQFAKSQNILCQGRGSAANSSVCYCLGITAVDPTQIELLFERFVSAARDEPPDIDVDFEHERREEVIQYIYKKYGRERVGMTATVVCYRARSAVREVGKALGLSLSTISALNKTVWEWSRHAVTDRDVKEIGLDPSNQRLRLTLDLARELIGFPRHLSQHVGGFVITQDKLSEMIPIENAAMTDRTVIEWDKDDIDALGILKVDILSLGILTCLRKSFDLVYQHYGHQLTLPKVPDNDCKVYDMLCQADSIGVFQVESRAQMSMLPRLKPREFYDLVIEVAIVRPGPIQGDMVHPYLRRRNGKEAVDYPSEELRQVLYKTLGVPLFQEQAMRIAVVAAGFSPEEADSLRRAMATFRKTSVIRNFKDKMISGMVARGYDRSFSENCFKQIEGFGEYGFPESHAASFALLVYISAWLKYHYPAAFAAALLNSQPMGFYAPAQIVRDVKDHGIEVRPPDINHSLWDCTLEVIEINKAQATNSTSNKRNKLFALRLGFRQIKQFKRDEAERVVTARKCNYGSIQNLWERTKLSTISLKQLARADSFASIGISRRHALWQIKGLDGPLPPLFAAAETHYGSYILKPKIEVSLPDMSSGEEVIEDYKTLRLSLKYHPLGLLRTKLKPFGLTQNHYLHHMHPGQNVKIAGLVLVRQRPSTAKGIVFITLEDETGIANIVVWPPIFDRYRRILLSAKILGAEGILQREGIVTHVIVKHLIDLSGSLSMLTTKIETSQNIQ